MASAHVYRANRPNTWLHRPSLRREDSLCQPGAVHTRPNSELTERPDDFRFLRYSEFVVLTASLSESDPEPTSTRTDWMLRPSPPERRIIKDAALHFIFLNQFGSGRDQGVGPPRCMWGTYRNVVSCYCV